MELTKKTKDNERDTVLDFWRGISILAVIVSHAGLFRFYPFIEKWRNSMAGNGFIKDIISKIIDKILIIIWNAGGVGVKIFLIISGYLITKTLLDELQQTKTISLTRFYARRFFRIIPAYAAYIGIVIISGQLGWIFLKPSDIPCSLFLANTTIAPCTWHFSHFWSLSVEEQFYLVWPITILAIPAIRRNVIFTLLYVMFALFSGLRILMAWGWINNSWAFNAILAGALYASSPRLRHLIKNSGVVVLTISIACIMILLSIGPLFARAEQLPPPLFLFLYSLIFSFFMLNLITSLHQIKKFTHSKIFRAISWIGTISYSAYLWQNIFTAPPNNYPTSSPFLFPLFFIPIVLISYYCIEKPIHEWSRARFARPK
jgi:peptidoglycan/LPS O-acetylase OafA/YrhL